MPENIIEVLETCGKEIKALKETIKHKTWEIEILKEKNKELCSRLEEFEKRMPTNPA